MQTIILRDGLYSLASSAIWAPESLSPNSKSITAPAYSAGEALMALRKDLPERKPWTMNLVSSCC